MSFKTTIRIRHNPSRPVTVLDVPTCLNCVNEPNLSQSVTPSGDGFVTDFEGLKPHKYREKLSLYLNTARSHAYPRAMRPHAYEGGVTDLFAGIGTSGQEFFPDARGNSRAIHLSFFSVRFYA